MHKTEKYSHPKRKGMLAVCSRGILGIITHDHRQKVRYGDGNEDVAYVGVALDTGRPWSSREPRILGTFQEFANSGLSWDTWLYRQSGMERVRK